MPEPEMYAERIARWFRGVTGEQADVFDSRLPGATTATIVPFTASDHRFVAKIYDRDIPGVGSRDVERDAAAMRAANDAHLAVPRLIDADATGRHLGHPSLLMTRIDGEPRAFGGDDAEGWVDGLADALIEIGNAPPVVRDVAAYASWLPETITQPAWSNNPVLWSDVAALLKDPLRASSPRFIHRDFHQLNVLWADGRTTGTVDWVNGCLGPIESDIASCRINIALADRRYDGVTLADRFLDHCIAAGLPWHPIWDLDFIAGVTDRPDMFEIGRDFGADMTFDSICASLETIADRAVANARR